MKRQMQRMQRMRAAIMMAVLLAAGGAGGAAVQAQYYAPYCDLEFNRAIQGAQQTRTACLDAYRDAVRTKRECVASYRYTGGTGGSSLPSLPSLPAAPVGPVAARVEAGL